MHGGSEGSLRQRLLPVNMSAESLLLVARGEGQEGDPVMPSAPAPDRLAIIEQASWQLNASLAGKLGFPLISVDSHEQLVVMLFGVARYSDVTAGGHVYRYGVSVRALIEIIDMNNKANFSPAAVAAQVELGLSEASAQLSVHGYTGDLSQGLPAWQSFDVNSYAHYLHYVNEIQHQVLHDVQHIEPVVLGSTLASELQTDDDIAISGHHSWIRSHNWA